MDSLPKSRLFRFVERAIVLARRAVARVSTRHSLKRFTPRQHVVLLRLQVNKTTTCRDLVGELIEISRIRDIIDLDSILASPTLPKGFDRSEMAVRWIRLNVSLSNSPPNGVTGIDAIRAGALLISLHEASDPPTVEQSKTTSLVDTATNAVLDIHVTTTWRHDRRIAPRVVTERTVHLGLDR